MHSVAVVFLSHEGTFPSVKSLFDCHVVRSIRCSEWFKSLKWFAFLRLCSWDMESFNKNLWSPSGHQKIQFWILAWKFVYIKVSVKIVYGEHFNAFGCSFLEIWILKYWPFHTNDASYLQKVTTKSVETFIINYSHWDLHIHKVSSQNWKFNFLVTWGDHRLLLKNSISQEHSLRKPNHFRLLNHSLHRIERT